MQKLVNSRNTKRSLPWEVKAEILSEFSNSMRRSGYSEEFRLDVIRCEMWCSAVVGPCDVQAAAADFTEQVNEVGKTCPVE